jgi:hypothetical protein
LPHTTIRKDITSYHTSENLFHNRLNNA